MALGEEIRPTQEELSSHLNSFGYSQLIGMRAERIQDGKGSVRIQVDRRLMHPQMIVHGGVIFTLADTAMSMALMSVLPLDTRFTTIEAKINYLAPARGGELLAEGTIVQRGRSIAVLEASIYNIDAGEQRLIARALGTFHISSSRPSDTSNGAKSA
jgi:acyl-CoA thioesterase